MKTSTALLGLIALAENSEVDDLCTNIRACPIDEKGYVINCDDCVLSDDDKYIEHLRQSAIKLQLIGD